ncbi:MAG: hypothetical protein LBS72_03375, partial [Oscillospiraceae bacterium]|nr:hypothetical protein [Oscillospiraceae bacterium]
MEFENNRGHGDASPAGMGRGQKSPALFGAAGRNSAIIEEWMKEYGTMILRCCYIYLKDYALAEDASQDTFIKA